MVNSGDDKSITAKVVSRAQLLILSGVILLGASAGFVGGWLGGLNRDNNRVSTDREQATQIVLNENEVVSKIAKEVGAGVVSVNVTSAVTASDFFGFGRPVEQRSAGTGFIVSEDGVIVTNRHVVPSGTSTVSVTLSDGTQLDDVEVIGRTNNNDTLDIAFLKIKDKKGKDLQPVKIGESAKMEVGYKVIAIGNALGQFQNTITSGILSGYGRSVQAYGESGGGDGESLQNLFQTDAAINQGNSGGPLVNINGEVIGVNTAVAGGQAENIGFAIPIDDVKGLITSVLEKGKLERPYLGVRYVQLTDDYAYQLNLDVKRGAYIIPAQPGSPTILPGSPAEKAGLKEKDIVIKINGMAIDEKNSLTSLLSRKSVGEEITLTILRDGKEQDIKVHLEAAPTG